MLWPEAENLLTYAALATTALLLLYGLLQIIRKNAPRSGWPGGILALVAAVFTVVALFVNTFVASGSLAPPALLAVVGVLSSGVGLLLFIVERLRRGTWVEQSSSLLLAGVGLLMVVAAIFVPLLPGQLMPSQTVGMSAVSATPTTTPDATATPMATVPTPTLTPEPTATFSPSPTITILPTATPTRERYSTRTPTPTPQISRYCGAVVDYNLNLRELPELDATVLDVIPYGSIVDVGARNEDASWWFVAYNDQWGWVGGEYITVEARCEFTPVLAD